MKKKTFELGSIEYRLPNVIETMRLLGKLGISGSGHVTEGSELVLMAALIENMAPFITKISAVKDGVEIKEWTDALNHAEFLAPLSQIGAEILSIFSGKDAKAATRKKR